MDSLARLLHALLDFGTQRTPAALVALSALYACVALAATLLVIPRVTSLFTAAGVTGADAHRKGRPVVPEALGVVAGLVYVVTLFAFIPVPFLHHLGETRLASFPHHRLAEFLSALLSVISMVLLGFADDVLNLRWRHKLYLPTIASLPLLMVYYVTYGVTWVVVPQPLRPFLGKFVDLGFLYYVYMASLAVFCTNAINIVAGINGVEVLQCVVTAVFVAGNSLYGTLSANPHTVETHLFCVFFMLPFLGVSMGLLFYNWHPASVFVGDTYCYFAGMAFAVVGILGHFSKTLLLFLIPQTLNFVLSAPQLFRLLPCPRHRMPLFNEATGLLEPSAFEYDSPALRNPLIAVPRALGVVRVTKRGKKWEVSNYTLLNALLVVCGPMREPRLAALVGVVQAACCVAGLFVRYGLAGVFYAE